MSRLRVRIPSPAYLGLVQVPSNYAHVAQLAEHFLGKDGVAGSIPVVGLNMGHMWKRG